MYCSGHECISQRGPTCIRQDSASHSCGTLVSTLSYYKGRAHTVKRLGGDNPPPRAYAWLTAPILAWKWRAGQWRRASIPQDIQVRVRPFATGWSWVRASRTGWLAMRDSDLVINPWCEPDRNSPPGDQFRA